MRAENYRAIAKVLVQLYRDMHSEAIEQGYPEEAAQALAIKLVAVAIKANVPSGEDKALAQVSGPMQLEKIVERAKRQGRSDGE